MKTKIEIIEKFVKSGSCGSIGCLSECPFFSKKKKVCKFFQTSLYESIHELREEKEQLKQQVEELKEGKQEEKKYSIVSGGFDPLHKGHIELINDAAKISKDGVIVIMNSDEWLKEIKHPPLLQRESREAILRSIKGVVDVVYDDFDVGATVKVALLKIREKYPTAKLSFCNGGDRSEYKEVPECDLCESLGIDLYFGVGGKEKIESSSSILEKYKKGILRAVGK